MKQLTRIGLVLSILWLCVIASLLAWKHTSLATLSLNEWGDFFAGVMAPLALFWLVLGYLQQGEELRLNTEALHAQQEELRRQVAETAVLAANSERQAIAAEQLAVATLTEAQRSALKEATDAMPIFRPEGGNGHGAQTMIRIRNAGATISKVTAACTNGGHIRIEPMEVFEAGGRGAIIVDNVTTWPFIFTISYRNKFSNHQTKTYEMVTQFQFLEIGTQQGASGDAPKAACA
jgi:hypothetical protein